MNKTPTTITFMLSLFLYSMLLHAQDSIKCNQAIFNDSTLDKLAGSWTATGNIGGDSVTYTFSNQWVLNHQFLEMTFADTATIHAYTAKVLIGYNCKKDKYIIHWMDNFGGAFSETLGYGTKKDNSIEMLFDYPEGKLMNTFTFDNKSNTWTSHSVIVGDKGVLTVFGHITLKRKK